MLLSHKAQAGYDWSRAKQWEKNTGSQGATGQPPLNRAEISFVYFIYNLLLNRS